MTRATVTRTASSKPRGNRGAGHQRPIAVVMPVARPNGGDVVEDPGEQHDLAAARPERVAALLAELDRWRTACVALVPRLGPSGEGVAPDPDTLKRLRALGYVQ